MEFICKELVVSISHPCRQSFSMPVTVENITNLQYYYVTMLLLIVEMAFFDITQRGVVKENFAKSPTLKGQIISVQ